MVVANGIESNNMDETININFNIPASALIETPTRSVADIKIIISYENPQAYGYPEVCCWSEEYTFSKDAINNIRRALNEDFRND